MKKFDFAYVDYQDIENIIINNYISIENYKKQVVKCPVYAQTSKEARTKILSKLSNEIYIHFDYDSEVSHWFDGRVFENKKFVEVLKGYEGDKNQYKIIGCIGVGVIYFERVHDLKELPI